jgi:hypothetical protein
LIWNVLPGTAIAIEGTGVGVITNVGVVCTWTTAVPMRP